MYAIAKTEAFKVIAFNKNGSQMMLHSAATLEALVIGYAKDVVRHEATGPHNILPTFKKILVWNVDAGFTGLELPYIATVAA